MVRNTQNGVLGAMAWWRDGESGLEKGHLRWGLCVVGSEVTAVRQGPVREWPARGLPGGPWGRLSRPGGAAGLDSPHPALAGTEPKQASHDLAEEDREWVEVMQL